jgi:hypothetical protein
MSNSPSVLAEANLLPDDLAVQPPKTLTPAAMRALAEAEQRRKDQAEKERLLANDREYAGRGGKDPVRYNDWEIKGIASDF